MASQPRTPIIGVPTSITAFIGRASNGPTDEPQALISYADYERIFADGGEGALSGAFRGFFVNGGQHAIVVRVDSPRPEALSALDSVERFNLLCQPDTPDDPIAARGLVEAAAQYCVRRGALLLVDPLADWPTLTDSTSMPPQFGDAAINAAAFFPRLREANGDLPPCGVLAGILARTDASSGVWKAPAGVLSVLRGVDGLAVTLNENSVRALRDRGVNSLRTIAGMGNVVWGWRTLAGAEAAVPEWKYVAVRRTALFLEQSVSAGTQWAAFEPNAEALWSQLRVDISAFLDTLFRRGAFQGITPSQAYFVKCDRDTMTQADIDAGLVKMVIGFAPLKPAEFVVLTLQQVAGGT